MDYINLNQIPLGLPGKLFRSPMPFAQFDYEQTTFKEYIDAEISTVVMLVEEGEDFHYTGMHLKEKYAQNEIKVIHFPIVDFDTPENLTEFKTTIMDVATLCQEGENVAVHCFAGRGRTGLFIALLARQVLNLNGQEAIDFVREHFPAVETEAQETLVREFDFGI